MIRHCCYSRTTACLQVSLIRCESIKPSSPNYRSCAADSLKMPRIHHQLQPDVLEMEVSDRKKGFEGFSESQRAALSALGHTVVEVEPIWSNPCAIKFTAQEGWEASGDPRKWEAGGAVV